MAERALLNDFVVDEISIFEARFTAILYALLAIRFSPLTKKSSKKKKLVKTFSFKFMDFFFLSLNR